MEKSLTLSALCVGFILLDTVNSFPIDISSVSEGVSNSLWLTNYFLIGLGFFLGIVSIFFGCVCCRNGKGFKEFTNSSVIHGVSHSDGFVNPALNSELSIFPPLGINANELGRFEPLADLKNQPPNLRPAAFSYTEQEISSQDWFYDPYNNFPRTQLKYVQEYGRGWFGRVVEGEAQNITPEEKVTKVMVKILHADATLTDQMYFLHEVKFYRDLKHPNILRLLGRCLETEPFLIILECYPNGDLKSFLSQNLASAQALVEQGVTLQMCSNITSGLQFMHDNKFIHTDLAARNCLVGPDLSVKIGDYGNSIEIFKSDYYCTDSVALPVRWCAPETLKCTDITIETREVTPHANIWSLGIVFWEICEFCKLPYAELNDDQVIVHVLGEKNYFLEKPNMICLYKDELYHLMKLCWKPPIQRPNASQICVVLNNLISSSKMTQKEVQFDSKRLSQDFEQRWQNLKPNSIPKKDNAIDLDQRTSVDCSIIPSKLKNAKIVDSSYVDSPLGIFLSNKNSNQESPQFGLKFDKKTAHKLDKNNLQKTSGCESESSIFKGKENIDLGTGNDIMEKSVAKVEFDCTTDDHASKPEMDSWLKGVEINNEEDQSFVMKISEAIRDLDATLALEKTSSSEDNSGKSSRQNSPGKNVEETNKSVVDIKLGNDTSSFINFTLKTFERTSLQNTEQPQSLNFTDPFNNKKSEECGNYSPLIMPFIEDPLNKCKSEILDESVKENDSLLCGQSRNSSDTDDEVWRRRIEKGEISEKVKEKSKSIANLMILTHIDSDDSDIDLEKPFEKGFNRASFIKRNGSFGKSSLPSNNFGSENDLTFAVLEDDFKESLKKLSNDHKEHGRFDSLGVILPSSADREYVWESLFKSSDAFKDTTLRQTDIGNTEKDSKLEVEKIPELNLPEEKNEQKTQDRNNFLGNVASEKFQNNKLIEEKDKTGTSSSVELAERHEKEENCLGGIETESFTEEYLKCDSKTCSSNCSDSLQNSSHSRESDVNCNTAVDNKTECSFLEKLTLNSSSPKENHREAGDSDERSVPFAPGDENLGLEKGESDQNASTENVDLSLESRSSSLLFNGLESVDNECSKVTGISDTKSKKAVQETEESFSKSFPLSVSDKFFTKSCENDFDENIPEENSTVIVGACEDFAMDYYKGLKTTSEDVNVKNGDVEQMDDFQNYSDSLDVWDKHLEKAFIQQLSSSDFDSVSFRSFGLDSSEDQETKQVSLVNQYKNFDASVCPVKSILDFIESEKLHTEKLDEPIHTNRLTSLSVMANEEEYEHFKLRTPDDERSSDSGFRDKGSLSESVEDACEGKYNLEDIEAELEEAFVKGVFGNCETDKEKDSNDLKKSNNFEFEETQFYEDESKNEEDFSDLNGEIEFWHNKEESDYYPEISEFNPMCSQGWYLHPADENLLTFNRSVNEDIVNALRNELRENLPVQSRSFDEFNDFFETEMEVAKRDPSIHFTSDFVLPLSPILEEQDPSNFSLQRNIENTQLDGNNGNRIKKNAVKLMDSVKNVDTNTFMQYLEYMIENEGRVLNEIEETEEDADESKENVTSPFLISEEELTHLEPDLKECRENVSGKGTAGGSCDIEGSSSALLLESSKSDESFKAQQMETKDDDILVVNINTNEATLFEKSGADFDDVFIDIQEQKDDFLEILTDNSENDGLVFTPEMLSPDRERSLSEISRDSNGTRTGDALSEITLSSPDLMPDCFSISAQDGVSHNETSELVKEENHVGPENKFDTFKNDVFLQDPVNEIPETPTPTMLQTPIYSFVTNDKESALPDSEKALNVESNKTKPPSEINQTPDFDTVFEANDLYEMSTSFMGIDDEKEEDTFSDFVEDQAKEMQTVEQKTHSDRTVEDSETAEWRSESSEDEEMSSSSGEFIWKDGNKESKIKAACASDFVSENSLLEKTQKNRYALEIEVGTFLNKNIGEGDNLNEGEDEDDNESSTGSSASITDFVPSAWNSQATPSRPALRSPDKKADKQKKNVWFKKQKYHCVYEYPREPSDNEDADVSPYKQSAFDENLPETPVKKGVNQFSYGLKTVELPNQHFAYGIPKVIDFSSYIDWDVAEGENPDLSLTERVSENGTGSTDLYVAKKSDLNFYNLSPFDYDFNTTDLNEGESEFFVSSSSRPFQKGTSTQVFSPEDNQSVFYIMNNAENKIIRSDVFNSKDFITPDSGMEDSTSVTPLDKVDLNQESVLLKVKNLTYPKADVINILNNLKINLTSEMKENDGKEIDFESFDNNSKSRNGFSSPENASIPLTNIGLGELRHTRGKLKLDLPRNHNTELGAIINKKNY